MQLALQRDRRPKCERIRPDLPPDTRIDVEWMNTCDLPDPRIRADLGHAVAGRPLRARRVQPEARARSAFPVSRRCRSRAAASGNSRFGSIRRALAARKLAVRTSPTRSERTTRSNSAGLSRPTTSSTSRSCDGRARGIAELAAIPVPVSGGVPARLGDLGAIAAGGRGLVRSNDRRRTARRPRQHRPAADGEHRRRSRRGIDELFRTSARARPAGRPLDDFLRPGGVRLAVRPRRARRDPDRRRVSPSLVLFVYLRELCG